MGARGGHGVLLATVSRCRRRGQPAHVVVRGAAGARRGGAGRRPAGGRAEGRPRGGRRARHPEGCVVEGVRLAGGPHARGRTLVAVGLLRGRHGDRRRREGAARLRVLRRAPAPGTRIVLALATNTWHAYNDFGGPNLYTGGTHVAMQRPMAAGYLYKPPGKGRRVTGTGRAGSAERRPRGLPPAQPPVGLRRIGGLARLGAAVHRVGRARGHRDRGVHERGPRGPPRGAGRCEPVPVGRPRRVLVARDARHRRGVHRARRQRGVLLGQHLVVAGAHRR